MSAPSEDLADLQGAAEEAALAAWTSKSASPLRFAELPVAVGERAVDALSVDRVSAALETARSARGGSGDEGERFLLRALAPAWLRQRCREEADELDARQARADRPAGGHEAALAVAVDPAERARLARAWIDEEAARAGALDDWRAARRSAAREVGARSVADLLGAAHPVAPEALVVPYERGAIAPLDQTVERAARDELARYGLAPDAAAVPVVGALGPHLQRVPQPALRSTLLRLNEAVAGGPLGAGPELADGLHADSAWSAWGATRDGRAIVVLGAVCGPAGLWRALGRYGAALRASFVAGVRGGVGLRFADPAFPFAAATLFRRLALCTVFRGWAALRLPDAAAADLTLREALVPREAWTYLSLVARGLEPDDPAVSEAMFRCRATPATPADRWRLAQEDPLAAAELRGTVLGLLLEERMRSRYDREWFRKRAARVALCEMWEAEPGRTAEEMARDLGLGTIEPTPVLDACRPQLRR